VTANHPRLGEGPSYWPTIGTDGIMAFSSTLSLTSHALPLAPPPPHERTSVEPGIACVELSLERGLGYLVT
jgi:hypothetical protein